MYRAPRRSRQEKINQVIIVTSSPHREAGLITNSIGAVNSMETIMGRPLKEDRLQQPRHRQLIMPEFNISKIRMLRQSYLENFRERELKRPLLMRLLSLSMS